jgi:hypothetical protein
VRYKHCQGSRQIKRSQEVTVVKIAAPVAQGRPTAQFCHAAEFASVHVENQEIKKKELYSESKGGD